MKVYKNIGTSLKKLAKVLFWVELIFFILMGVMTILYGIGTREQTISIVTGITFILLGLLVAWLSNCVLYAFGQLVEDTRENKLLLSQIKEQVSAVKSNPEVHI